MQPKEFCAIQYLNDIVGSETNTQKAHVSVGTYNLHMCDLQRQHDLEIQKLKDQYAITLREELEDQAQAYIIKIEKIKYEFAKSK